MKKQQIIHINRGGYKTQLTLFGKNPDKFSSKDMRDERVTNLMQRIKQI